MYPSLNVSKPQKYSSRAQYSDLSQATNYDMHNYCFEHESKNHI